MNLKLTLSLVALATLLGCATTDSVHSEAERPKRQISVKSPDGTIEFILRESRPLTYSVAVDGRPVLSESRLGLKFKDGQTLGANARLLKVERREANTTWENKLGKRRVVSDHHQELHAKFLEQTGRSFEIVVRVFNDGLGFRYVLPEVRSGETQTFILEEEQTQFAFPDNYACYAGINENTGKPENPIGYIGSQETEFKPSRLSDLPTQQVRMVPLLVETPGAWVAITESDLYDWAGLWLNRVPNSMNTSNSTAGVKLAARLAPRLDGQGLVKSTFPRQSPWRTLLIARQPGRLIESDLVNNLASPCRLQDPSWVRPGKMAWDHWWSGDVKMDTATLKEYVQLAADMGWPYQLVDWQWYGPYNKPTASITNVNPAVDMDELRRFAKEKGVRLWLWLYWTDADRNDAYKQAFELYEKWGIAGIKIDFMNRDDQEMVNWYEKLTRAAAEHHLMINFHGAYKPTGMIRTYPNQVTREGILGNEYNRWSARVTPEHKLTFPFTRFLAGPADFTPGGFLNRQPEQFRPDGKAAQVQGTRCAELALFVVYDSPVCCVCDHPSHYRNQPGADFLKLVPTVWDDTRVLDATVGERLLMARRKGDRWFLGALTARNPRDFAVKLDFLSHGTWKARIWKDAEDSETAAEHLVTEERTVSSGDVLNLHLARYGGAVVQFEVSP
jgi:alpha-glucosidase